MKINNVYIPLKQEWKKIGISLSGGADSALLAYLVLSNTNADIYFTTQVRMWKTRPWQRWIAKDVVGWFREEFNNRIEHIEGFIPPEMEEPTEYLIKDEYGAMKSGNRVILRSHNEYIGHLYKLDAWYAGVTLNPTEEFDGKLNDREYARLPVEIEHMGATICHPFTNVRKDWIIKQYLDNEIGELLEITRSCEGEFEDINYTNYMPYQQVPTCGKCFWCKEREWGIANASK